MTDSKDERLKDLKYFLSNIQMPEEEKKAIIEAVEADKGINARDIIGKYIDPETKKIIDEVDKANPDDVFDRHFCTDITNLIKHLKDYDYTTKPGPAVLYVSKNDIKIKVMLTPEKTQRDMVFSWKYDIQKKEVIKYKYLIEFE